MKSKPVRFTLYGIIGVLIVAVIGGIWYMLRAGGGSLPVEGQAPNFSAQDVSLNKTVSMQSLSGKIVLITWYYTHCTDECPLTMYRFEQIQQQLEKQGTFGKNVILVAMTLDPTRDTPPVIRQYANHFHANANGWYFLRANPAQTIQILNAWGIKVKPSTDKEFIEHTSKTDLIDQNGNIRAEYNTANLNPNQVVHDVNSLVSRTNWL
ncbi:SCO family protein [Alicyclobacillus cycloheptanicus]|uniref:Protein SCO1/2 n=1 Tax=Alicyclobacillus cycloheptanicus TaxID=1457 RepID=A0ABT9XEX4_9BACL|nr:SCO family protein [Alicyclobacillus cycloheptanicus]MDQ0188629.1 protein SCO1/2 [Alicyclobacillus cycloheptanicus]WDM00695.1 SCO family protein [Alicyclobacillus cycloheptanicus]